MKSAESNYLGWGSPIRLASQATLFVKQSIDKTCLAVIEYCITLRLDKLVSIYAYSWWWVLMLGSLSGLALLAFPDKTAFKTAIS